MVLTFPYDRLKAFDGALTHITRKQTMKNIVETAQQ